MKYHHLAAVRKCTMVKHHEIAVRASCTSCTVFVGCTIGMVGMVGMVVRYGTYGRYGRYGRYGSKVW